MIDILIVEDDPATYKALPIILRHRGYSTLLVKTLGAALEEIKKEPRFALLDLMLPDGNGIEILKYVASHGLKTRCAVTTAYLDDETAALGFPVFIKPISLESLLEFLRN